MRKIYTFVSIGLIVVLSARINAQSFVEEFEDVTLLIGNGWDTINASAPIGTVGWFQGSASAFTAQSMTGYIGANFNNTAATGTTNIISNWLMAPLRTLRNGDVIIFYARSFNGFADRLQVRLSQSGTSTNMGGTATSTGDFSTLLLDINPTYNLTAFPNVWTKHTLTLSGLPGSGVSGRFAFRYFVENGGSQGANSDYIGIDSLAYTAIPASVEEHTNSSIFSVYPNPTQDQVQLNFDSGNTAERTITITDIVGKVVFEQVFKGSEVSVNVSELNVGVYMLSTKGEDGVGRKKLVIE